MAEASAPALIVGNAPTPTVFARCFVIDESAVGHGECASIVNSSTLTVATAASHVA